MTDKMTVYSHLQRICGRNMKHFVDIKNDVTDGSEPITEALEDFVIQGNVESIMPGAFACVYGMPQTQAAPNYGSGIWCRWYASNSPKYSMMVMIADITHNNVAMKRVIITPVQ